MLKDMLKILVDTGTLDEAPSLYSPFYRSQTDLFCSHWAKDSEPTEDDSKDMQS